MFNVAWLICIYHRLYPNGHRTGESVEVWYTKEIERSPFIVDMITKTKFRRDIRDFWNKDISGERLQKIIQELNDILDKAILLELFEERPRTSEASSERLLRLTRQGREFKKYRLYFFTRLLREYNPLGAILLTAIFSFIVGYVISKL